jgi:hypothetical protein
MNSMVSLLQETSSGLVGDKRAQPVEVLSGRVDELLGRIEEVLDNASAFRDVRTGLMQLEDLLAALESRTRELEEPVRLKPANSKLSKLNTSLRTHNGSAPAGRGGTVNQLPPPSLTEKIQAAKHNVTQALEQSAVGLEYLPKIELLEKALRSAIAECDALLERTRAKRKKASSKSPKSIDVDGIMDDIYTKLIFKTQAQKVEFLKERDTALQTLKQKNTQLTELLQNTLVDHTQSIQQRLDELMGAVDSLEKITYCWDTKEKSYVSSLRQSADEIDVLKAQCRQQAQDFEVLFSALKQKDQELELAKRYCLLPSFHQQLHHQQFHVFFFLLLNQGNRETRCTGAVSEKIYAVISPFSNLLRPIFLPHMLNRKEKNKAHTHESWRNLYSAPTCQAPSFSFQLLFFCFFFVVCRSQFLGLKLKETRKKMRPYHFFHLIQGSLLCQSTSHTAFNRIWRFDENVVQNNNCVTIPPTRQTEGERKEKVRKVVLKVRKEKKKGEFCFISTNVFDNALKIS